MAQSLSLGAMALGWRSYWSSGGVLRGELVTVDGRPTCTSRIDPEANRTDPDFGQLVGDDQG